MLSMSLALRQGRCIQSAVVKSAFFKDPSALAASSTLIKNRILNRDFQKTNYSSTLVPARHFSATPARRSGGDHSFMWKFERYFAAAMIPGLVVPFIITNPITDALFCTILTVHAHWGMEAIVIDYIRPCLFKGSTVIPKISHFLVWVLSSFTLGALYYFAYTDVGLVNAIKMLWKL